MFTNRRDAGYRLAEKLTRYRGRTGVLVLGLPRGGVVTAREIARTISAPLDVLVVRKIGFPGQQELAIGAVSETGAIVLNQNILSYGHISEEYVEHEIALQKEEIARRTGLYRGGRRIKKFEGKDIILVDDGVATGATMKAAIVTLKQEKIERLVVALPVAPLEAAGELKAMVDDFECLYVAPDFLSVSQFYNEFPQVGDQEVIDILRESGALTEA